MIVTAYFFQARTCRTQTYNLIQEALPNINYARLFWWRQGHLLVLKRESLFFSSCFKSPVPPERCCKSISVGQATVASRLQLRAGLACLAFKGSCWRHCFTAPLRLQACCVASQLLSLFLYKTVRQKKWAERYWLQGTRRLLPESGSRDFWTISSNSVANAGEGNKLPALQKSRSSLRFRATPRLSLLLSPFLKSTSDGNGYRGQLALAIGKGKCWPFGFLRKES